MVPAAALVERIKAVAQSLRRVEGAIELAAILQGKAKPQAGSVEAFVVPMGRKGGAADAAAGAFIQPVDQVFSVFLIFATAGDPTGARKIATVDEVEGEVIEAIAGWAPDDAVGVFRLAGSSIVRFEPGIIVTQIEFAIADQLRILS